MTDWTDIQARRQAREEREVVLATSFGTSHTSIAFA